MKSFYYYFLVCLFYAQNIFARGGDGNLGDTDIPLDLVGGGLASGMRTSSGHFGGVNRGKLVMIIILGGVLLKLIQKIWIYFEVKKKHQKIRRALAAFASIDESWNEQDLIDRVKYCFVNCQIAWSEQNLTKLEKLMLPEIFGLWKQEIINQKKLNQRNRLSDIEVLDIIIVDAEDRYDDEKDRFTAYIKVSMTDEMLQDGLPVRDPIEIIHKKFLIFPNRPHLRVKHRRPKYSRFGEFWSFEWENGEWLVRNIRQENEWYYFVDKKIIQEVVKKKAA